MKNFESWSFLGGDRTSLFTLEHETRLTYFILCTLHKGIFISRWWILGRSHSLEVIRFLSHWSMRYDWVIWLDVFIRERSPLIGIDKFFEMIRSGHRHLWELVVEFSHIGACYGGNWYVMKQKEDKEMMNLMHKKKWKWNL